LESSKDEKQTITNGYKLLAIRREAAIKSLAEIEIKSLSREKTEAAFGAGAKPVTLGYVTCAGAEWLAAIGQVARENKDLKLADVDVLCIRWTNEDNHIKQISLRPMIDPKTGKIKVDSSAIARQFGGNGHPPASGVQNLEYLENSLNSSNSSSSLNSSSFSSFSNSSSSSSSSKDQTHVFMDLDSNLTKLAIEFLKCDENAKDLFQFQKGRRIEWKRAMSYFWFLYDHFDVSADIVNTIVKAILRHYPEFHSCKLVPRDERSVVEFLLDSNDRKNGCSVIKSVMTDVKELEKSKNHRLVLLDALFNNCYCHVTCKSLCMAAEPDIPLRHFKYLLDLVPFSESFSMQDWNYVYSIMVATPCRKNGGAKMHQQQLLKMTALLDFHRSGTEVDLHKIRLSHGVNLLEYAQTSDIDYSDDLKNRVDEFRALVASKLPADVNLVAVGAKRKNVDESTAAMKRGKPNNA
jgi:hypothetical protein